MFLNLAWAMLGPGWMLYGAIHLMKMLELMVAVVAKVVLGYWGVGKCRRRGGEGGVLPGGNLVACIGDCLLGTRHGHHPCGPRGLRHGGDFYTSSRRISAKHQHRYTLH